MKANEVLIRSAVGRFQVVALLGQDPPQITDGIGGWSTIDRPRRTGMTLWKGRDPFQMSLPIMLDGWEDRVSQEGKIRQLMWMALPVREGQPSTVTVYGALPFPSGGQWIINKIDFGNIVIWSNEQKPVRLRQDVTLTLLQFVEPDQVELLVSNQGLRPKRKGPYTVKAGDNLKSIAQREYGDPDLWHKIADANNIRGSKIPTTKKTLVIP